MYQFGCEKNLATLEETENYIEITVKHEIGNDILEELEKYKDKLQLVKVTRDMAVIRIYDTKIKEALAFGINNVLKVRCYISEYKDGLHIKFSSVPYRKCSNYLERAGLNRNRKRTKWWKENLTENEKYSIINKMMEFPYLKVEVEK